MIELRWRKVQPQGQVDKETVFFGVNVDELVVLEYRDLTNPEQESDWGVVPCIDENS